MLRLAPSCRLINGYGPTENTTFTCCHTIPPDWDEPGAVPIGHPINGTGVRILDTDLQPVREGEAGELCVAGDGVALGYLNRPTLTQGALRAGCGGRDAVSQRATLVRRRVDGVIEFLGRIDRQVKINGKRIELTGIEAALCEITGVSDAVALVDDANGIKRILAFVVANEGAAHADTLAAHLASRMPGWMLPSRITVVPALPLTRNGKVDRASLLASGRDASPVQAPQGTTERDLARIWAGVLSWTPLTVGATSSISAAPLCNSSTCRRRSVANSAMTCRSSHCSRMPPSVRWRRISKHVWARQSPLTAARERAGRQAEALRPPEPRSQPHRRNRT